MDEHGLQYCVNVFVSRSARSVRGDGNAHIAKSRSGAGERKCFVFAAGRGKACHHRVASGGGVMVEGVILYINHPVVDQSVGNPLVEQLTDNGIELHLKCWEKHTVDICVHLSGVVSDAVLRNAQHIVQCKLTVVRRSRFQCKRAEVMVDGIGVRIILGSAAAVYSDLDMAAVPIFLNMTAYEIALVGFPDKGVSVFANRTVQLKLRTDAVIISDIFSAERNRPCIDRIFLLAGLGHIVVI